MKENTNEMILVFDSIPANEGLARVTAASFLSVRSLIRRWKKWQI